MSNEELYEDEEYIYAVCKNPQYEDFYRKKNSTIWNTSKIDAIGEVNISFDKKKIYNLFKDYPYNMTKEEIEILKKEEPYWVNFFSWRVK